MRTDGAYRPRVRQRKLTILKGIALVPGDGPYSENLMDHFFALLVSAIL